MAGIVILGQELRAEFLLAHVTRVRWAMGGVRERVWQGIRVVGKTEGAEILYILKSNALVRVLPTLLVQPAPTWVTRVQMAAEDWCQERSRSPHVLIPANQVYIHSASRQRHVIQPLMPVEPTVPEQRLIMQEPVVLPLRRFRRGTDKAVIQQPMPVAITTVAALPVVAPVRHQLQRRLTSVQPFQDFNVTHHFVQHHSQI
jgi:hypothetical protein